MIRAILILVCLSACSADSASLHEHPIRSSYSEDGKEIGWYVSDSKFNETPAWKFDGKNSPPLSMPDAYQRAYAWLQKSFPKMSSFKLRSYGLSTAGSSRAPDRWYYTFDFFGDLEGSTVMNSKFSVMVLMDGTVVEPREK